MVSTGVRPGDAALTLAVAGLAVLIVSTAITAPGGGDPLNLRALRERGLALDRRGRLAEADAVLSFVGRRTWRDGPTAAWLLRRRLNQGRYQEAFASADSLLRRDAEGTTRPALFALFIGAAAYPEARLALETRLAAAPWWRGDFLRALGTTGGPGAQAVFAALAGGPTPPSADEYAPLINRLVSAGDPGDAYAAWRAIARRGHPAPGALHDGDFSGASDHTPFTWSAASGVGAASGTGPVSDGPGSSGLVGQALRVEYDGYSAPGLPAQMLAHAPPRYRLSWRERVDPADPERLFWRVRCDGADRVIARAPAAAPGWRERAMDVNTPRSGCSAQWLELAAAPGERRNPVTAWYAAFQLRPIR